MFGKVAILALVFCAPIIGCAQPKYETVVAPPAENFSEKVTDCKVKFSASGHCVLWQWEKAPTASDSGSLIFKIVRPNLLDGSAVLVDIESVPAVVLWMPGMGHGSSPTHVEKVDTGSFRAKDVFFVMPGEWEIKFQIKNGNTVEDEAVVALTI